MWKGALAPQAQHPLLSSMQEADGEGGTSSQDLVTSGLIRAFLLAPL